MQPTLLDALDARDAAIERAGDAAPAAWIRAATETLDELIEAGQPFSTDDLWARLPAPPEPRAMGAVIVAASRAKRIVQVGYRKSERARCHARPIPVWVRATAKGGSE